MPDCIFCKLANHEIETSIVYEDDLVCAFNDASPVAPVHVLVVPKEHYQSIADDVPAEVMAALMNAVNEVARITGIAESGYRIVANTGKDADQVVQHLHIHVLGGKFLGSKILAE